MTLNRSILTVVLALTLGLATIARGQTPFHDAAYGFSLTLPKGWSVAPPEVTSAAEQFASQNTPNKKFRYFGSLMKIGTADEPEGLIVLQHTPENMSKVSLKDFEREFKKMNAAELTKKVGEKSGGTQGFGIDGISVDMSRPRCTMTGMVSTDDGPQKVLMVVYPCPTGFIQLNCYWDPKDDSKMRPEMDAIANTFAFDAGREWVPSTSSGSAYSYGRTGGVIGLGVVLLVWIGRKVAGK
ncbi:MAG: hypothetical protein ACREJO_02620 [Phycisphaerales bacterium]